MTDKKTKQDDLVGDITDMASKSSRKKSYKLWAVLLVVAIVALVAGCTPATNSGGSKKSSVDELIAKYEVDHGPGDPYQLVTFHYSKGYECLDCHDETFDATNMGTNEFCLDSCHSYNSIVKATNDYAGLYARGISTSFRGLDQGLNPHRSHMEGLQCSDCHTMHGTSIMECNECHYLPLPAGWTDVYDGVGSPKLK